MTQNVQISGKANNGDIAVVGGDNVTDFQSNLVALGFDDAEQAFVVAKIKDLLLGPGEPHGVSGAVANVQAGVPGAQPVPQAPPAPQGAPSAPPAPRPQGVPGSQYTDRHYLNIGYADAAGREEAKKYGARFDGERKAWFISDKFNPPENVQYVVGKWAA